MIFEKKTWLVLMTITLIFILTAAGFATAGEDNYDNESEYEDDYYTEVDDYTEEESSNILLEDEEIVLHNGSSVNLKGLAICGRTLYNPRFSNCLNPATSQVCRIGMEACGPNSCYNPRTSYCANPGTGLVCNNRMESCRGNSCFDPMRCVCTPSGVRCR